MQYFLLITKFFTCPAYQILRICFPFANYLFKVDFLHSGDAITALNPYRPLIHPVLSLIGQSLIGYFVLGFSDLACTTLPSNIAQYNSCFAAGQESKGLQSPVEMQATRKPRLLPRKSG
jgi:hypothetical protein